MEDNKPKPVLTLGQKIREERRRRDLTLTEFANRLDIRIVHLCDIEHDRAYADPELISAFSRELGLPIELLRSLQSTLDEKTKRWIESTPIAALLLKFIMKSWDPAATTRSLLPMAKELSELRPAFIACRLDENGMSLGCEIQKEERAVVL